MNEANVGRVILALAVLALSVPAWAVPTPAEAPVEVLVFLNRALDDQAIIKISGLDQDPTLSVTEVTRRLQSTSLFSDVQVTRDRNRVRILVREKTTWFVLPYLSFGSSANVYGLAAGKSSALGQNGNILGRYQFGTGDHEGSILIRDEFFLNSDWALGASFDYENALHRIYDQRTIKQETNNEYHGGSLQTAYHIDPHAQLFLNTYIERHRFEEPPGDYHRGLQLSHRLGLEIGNFYQNEGLARGTEAKIYFEATNPASDFQFRKTGLLAQLSAYKNGDLNWIVRPRFETGSPLPRYQLFELGAAKLRSYEFQEFRDNSYVAVQNDLLLLSLDVWKLKVRPLLYTDWAFIQNEGRLGVGVGFQVFVRSVVIPALQVFGGYGFEPIGFSVSAAIGPQF